MADRFAVAAGNWNNTATWSDTSGGAPGFSFPTVADNAFFDAASPAGTYTVNVSSACLDLDFTGFTGTFAGSSSLEVRGSWVGGAGMTRTYTGTITFTATDARTITSNGKALDGPITFNGVGGTWALQDDLTTGATRTSTLTNGTLDLGANDLSTGIFSSSNSNARVITGSGDIRLTNASGTTTVWNTSTQTNLTLSGWTGTLRLTGANSSTRTISCANFPVVEMPAVSVEAGSGGITLARTNVLSYTQTSGYTGVMSIASNSPGMEVRSTISLDPANGSPVAAGGFGITFIATSGVHVQTFGGKTLDMPITVNAPGATIQLSEPLTIGNTKTLTLTAGTLDIGAHDVTAGRWFVRSANTRAITGSGDAIITNASGVTTIWDSAADTNLDISGWSGAIRVIGANTSERTIAGDPTPTIVMPPIFIEAGSGGITITSVVTTSYTQTSGYSGILTFGTGGLTTGAISLDPANGTPAASANALTLTATGTPDFGGKVADFPVTINAPGATVTLADALDIQARALTFTAGTFDADGNDIDAGSVVATGSGTRSIDITGSTVTLASTGTAWDATGSNITLTATGSTIACTDPDVTFAGGGKTYNVVQFARGGDIVITGSNTIATLALA